MRRSTLSFNAGLVCDPVGALAHGALRLPIAAAIIGCGCLWSYATNSSPCDGNVVQAEIGGVVQEICITKKECKKRVDASGQPAASCG